MSEQSDFDDNADDLFFDSAVDSTPSVQKQMRGDDVSVESDSGPELQFVAFDRTPNGDGRLTRNNASRSRVVSDTDDSMQDSSSDDQYHSGKHPFDEYTGCSDDQKTKKTRSSLIPRSRKIKRSSLQRKYYPDEELDMAHHFLELSGVNVEGIENVNGRYERTNRVATERPIWEKFHTGKRCSILFSGNSWWVLSSNRNPILQNQERTFIPPKKGWDIYIGEGQLRAAPQVTLAPAKVPHYAAALRTEYTESPVHNKLYREAEHLAMVRRYKSVATDRRLRDEQKDASIHRDVKSNRQFPVHLAHRKVSSKPPSEAPVYTNRMPKRDLKDLRLLKLSTQKSLAMRQRAEAEREKNSYDGVTRVRQDIDPISTLEKVAQMGPVRHAQRWVAARNQRRAEERIVEDAHGQKSRKGIARPLSRRQQDIASKMHARSLGRPLSDGMISYLAEKEREDSIVPPPLVQWSTMEAEQESAIRLYRGGPPFGHYCPELLDGKLRLVHRWPNLPFQRQLPDGTNKKMSPRTRVQNPMRSGNFLQRLRLRTELQKESTPEPQKAVRGAASSADASPSPTMPQGRPKSAVSPLRRQPGSPPRAPRPASPPRSRSPSAPRKASPPVNRGRAVPPQKPGSPSKRAPFASPSRVGGVKNKNASGAVLQSPCSKPMSKAHRAYRKEMMRLGIRFSPSNAEINQTGYSSLLLRQERARAQQGRTSKKVLQREVARHVDFLYRDAKVRSDKRMAIRKARATLARQQQKFSSVHENAKGRIDPKWHHRLAIPRGALSDKKRLYELRDKASGDATWHPMEFKSKGFHLDKDKPDLTREEAARVGFVIWGGRNASTSAESNRVMQKVAERLLI